MVFGHGRVGKGLDRGLDIVPMGRSVWREFLGGGKPMGRKIPMGRVLGRIVAVVVGLGMGRTTAVKMMMS